MTSIRQAGEKTKTIHVFHFLHTKVYRNKAHISIFSLIFGKSIIQGESQIAEQCAEDEFILPNQC